MNNRFYKHKFSFPLIKLIFRSESLFALFIIPTQFANGQFYIPDTTFSSDGLVNTPILYFDDIANEIAVLPDGSIILGGTESTDIGDYFNANFALAKYLPDGSLDESFGDGGIVRSDFSGVKDFAEDMVIQPDGKILLGGWTSGGSMDFAVARYLPDGSLDMSFSDDGFARVSVVAGNDYANAIALQADGKILLAGYSGSLAGYTFTVLRFNPDGSQDYSFNYDGIAIFIPEEDGTSYPYAMTLQSDGKILVGGYSHGESVDFTVVRFMQDGKADTSYGDDGMAQFDFVGTNDIIYALQIQPDGKLIAAGYCTYPDSLNHALAIARLNEDGSLDNTFSGDGKNILFMEGSETDKSYDIYLQDDGKILLCGMLDFPDDDVSPEEDYDFLLARFLSDGNVDEEFGTGGILLTDFNGYDDAANAITIDAEGRILAAGSAIIDDKKDFAVVRYAESDENISIDELHNSADYVLFPNPSSGTINIKPENAAERIIEIKISDLTGQIIYSNKNGIDLNYENGFVRLTLPADLPSGNYIISLLSINSISNYQITIQ